MSEKPFERQFTKIEWQKPRKEFYRGEIPLSFEHEFSGGARLKAEQDEDGFGRFSVTKDGETIFDTDTDLPDGFKIITPTRLNLLEAKHPRLFGGPEENLHSLWTTNLKQKAICVGDVRSPSDFLTLLHEIGHAEDSEQKGIIKEFTDASTASIFTKTKKDTRDTLLASAKANAKYERRAWAYGVIKLREIAKNGGFDIKDVFPSHTSLQDFVHTHLETYRYAHEACAIHGAYTIRDPLVPIYDNDFGQCLEHAFHGAGPSKESE